MTEEAHPTQTAGKLAPSAESITQLVHGFYGDVRRDPLLGPVFEKALHGHWDAHLQRLVDFWSTVALGARSFKGDVFGKHMALEGVTPAHFAAWVALWQQHTNRLFAPEVAHDLQVAAHGIARNLFRGYFANDPGFVQPRDEGHGRHRRDEHGARHQGSEETQRG
ncbi:group III truncated hemoglobin [Acidovorax sp. K2F]|uniref:group III truncated hemoglobin n=1 Tax=Acidovorax sp. K2F TaxID=2978125 RepID=UPI0021B1232C|nr:group III truncated hemoglobin [Acidovorax sp. K2F]MCT6719852.1 group III truncated hemoglobin [Acidovorax sp. K2F]